MQSTTKQPLDAAASDVTMIGIKTGQCQICKQTRQILILKYGFSLCDECLNVCIKILEQLQNEATQKPLIKPKKRHRAFKKSPRTAVTKARCSAN